MANSDKLWFDIDIRGNALQVVQNLVAQAQALGAALDEAKLNKNFIANAENLERVFDKIAVAYGRINEARSNTKDTGELARLKSMEKELKKMERAFEKLGKNDWAMVSKGSVPFERLVQGLQLAVEQVGRYTNEINAQAKADEREKAAESKRIDDLKAKYNELYNIRKQLQDAVLSAAPGTDTSGATSMINSLSARIGAIKRSMNGGTGLPASSFGADSDEFLRKAKEETRNLTIATDSYNKKLSSTVDLQRYLQKLSLDTESQQKIAGIRKQTNEYSALGMKLQEINSLIARMNVEEQRVRAGGPQVYTREVINTELDAIQRRYNEALAAGKQREVEDAEAKNKKAAAAKRATDAVQMLAHANQGLIASYNRVAEAGSKAGRINIQFQNQIAGYAGLYGIERLVKSIVTIGGQFEVQHVALQNILGDVQEANILFGQLQSLAVESPKTFMELTAYTKQLSAYQIPANELFDTTKRLADLSSGLGVDMSRLILAYGQVRSAAVLRGQELRQFTEAGIPMVQALADKFTEMNGKLTTTADVFKLISQRAVPFKMVQEVLWDMTSQGGQFYNMQAELADTLYGKWQKLQDQWQITLGRIAEGNTLSGKFFKTTLEGLVSLTATLGALLPLFGSIAAFRGGLAVWNGAKSRVQDLNGQTAIKNMLIAKDKEAARLERERLMYGRQLTAAEKELVATKNQLRSTDYYLLASEKQITALKAHQLMLDGKMEKSHFYRLLQMQGYTREQRLQIANGNIQALQSGSMLGKLGSGLWGLIGGWPGLIMTALGAAFSAWNYFDGKSEELSQKGDAMMSHAQQGANNLESVISNVEKGSDTTFKKIEALEEALIGMGDEGKRIVGESREIDDISKRFEVLTEKAKAYKEVLDGIGTPQGKALYEQAISDSDIEDNVKDYEDERNSEIKLTSSMERFSMKYAKMIDALKQKYEELKTELNGSNVFENLRILLSGKYANEVVGYYSGSPAGKAITEYYKAVRDTDEAMEKIRTESIPKAMSSLKSLAIQNGIDINKSYEQLTEAEKTKLIGLASEFAKGLQAGADDTKNSIANWLAQGFYAKLILTPTVDVNTETGVAYSLSEWQKKNGYGTLWNEQDRKMASTDPLAFSKKNSQRKVDTQTTIKNIKTQLDSGLLRQEVVQAFNSQLKEQENILKGLEASEDAGFWTFDKSLTKGKKGGSKSDPEAKRLRERVRILKEAESSYQYWRKLVGDEGAVPHVNEEFGKLLGEQGFKFEDVEKFSKTLEKLRKAYEKKPKSKEMLEALKEIDKIFADLRRKDFEKEMKDLTSAMDRALSNMAQQWSTFKAVRDATGNRALASQMAGLTGARAGFTNQADDMKALLSNDISGIDFAKVFSIGNDGEALKKYVISLGVAENQIEGVVKALTKWQELQRQVINADIQSFAALIGGLKDYDSEIQKIDDRLAQQKQSNQNLVGTTDGNGQVITQEQADKANNIAEVKANDEKWQKSVTYINLMNNALALTKRQVSEGITQAQDILNQKLDAGVISAKEYADEMQRIREITDNINKNSLFGANNSFTSYVRGGSGGLRTYLNTQIREAQMTRDNTKATPQQRIEASYRLNAANSKLQGLDKFDKTVGSTAVAVGALGDALQPVIKLFDELGMKEVGQVLGGIQSATNAAATTGTAAIAAFGQSAGPYGAAIGAGLSILGSVGSALFSDTSHEDAVALRATLQNQTEVLSDQMQEIIKEMGESYGTEALRKYEELRNNYEGQTRAYRQQIRSIMGDNYGSGHSEGYHFNRWFSWLGPWLRDRFGINSQDSDGFWWIQSALEALSPEQWKEFKFENPEAYSQLTSAGYNEGDLKRTTEGMIKLAEDMKEAQKQLAEQMAGTSFDTIFDDFLNGLYEIGNGAEDVFDDIEKGWKKMINKMIINNLVAQDLKNKLQDWYDNVFSPWNANGRKEDAGDIFGKLQEIEDWAITTTDGLRHRNGLFDVAEDDVSRKGVITGSFNENETGLLLSYVNSIRADVSLNRQTLYQILQYVQGQAEMPVLASAQLEQLQTLVALARDRNDFVSEIRDILHSSQTGVKPLRVS